MEIEPGALLASGRAADVFDQGDGTVLRRYRTAHDCRPEAQLMSWLHERGFPVPMVHHVGDRDIVMARIAGPLLFMRSLRYRIRSNAIATQATRNMETGIAMSMRQPKERRPKLLSGIPIQAKRPVTMNNAR